MSKHRITVELIPGVFWVKPGKGVRAWLFSKLYYLHVTETGVDDHINVFENMTLGAYEVGTTQGEQASSKKASQS